ncbi:MAG: hypothetical protein KUG77_14090, partial [Nannocystaceae bacterium]|nr:hypothetical protein [Nannocystaceae bacterium]
MNPSWPPATRTSTDRLLVGLLLACGTALAVSGPGLTRWLGTMMLLGGAWELRFLVRGPLPKLRLAAPVLVLLGAYVALFWELLLGRPPASRDHAIHYFQTRLLWDELIPSGRLWGWSDTLGAGYPYGESYPTAGYLLGGLCNAATLGLVSPRASYAWGIAVTWALGMVAVGWLAHTIVSTLRRDDRLSARWAFCAGGLLWLFDAGASRQGGWNYLLFHGVWPQMFSAVLWALSLTLTMRALERPSPRRIAAAALILGASVTAHPFGMLAAAASAGLLLVAVFMSPGNMPAPLRTWAIVHLSAAAVALSVVLVFFGSAAGMARSPVQWSPLGQLSYETLTGGLFPTHWAWLGPLFILGLLAIVRRPSTLGLFALLLCAALVVLGSHESMTVLRLDLVVAGFKNLQFPRYTIELKPVMFAIAGVGAVLLPAAVRSVAPSLSPSRPRAWLLAAVAAPFLATFAPDLGRLKTRPVGALDTLEANPEGVDEAGMLALLRKEAALVDGPLKVAYLRHGMGGGMFPIYAIADAKADLVLDGHIAAVNFKHRVRRDPVGYDALGVTHVIHDRALSEREETFAARLTEIGRFGHYHLARYTPEVTMPRVTVDHGSAAVTTDDNEHVVIDIDSPAASTVLLRQAPHLRWKATFEGESVDIEPAKQVTGLTLLSVRVPGSGQLEFTYRRTRTERIAGWVAVLAWVLGLGALTRGQPLRFRQREVLSSKRWWPVAVVLALVALVALERTQASSLGRTWQHFAADRAYRGAAMPEDDDASEDQRPRLIRDLVDEDAVVFRRTPSHVCNGLTGKDVLTGCSEAEHRPVRATTYRAPYLFRCLEFGVPPGGVVELELGDGEHDVLGRITRRLLGAPGRKLKFGVGKTPRKLASDNLDFFVRAEGRDGPRVAT